MDTRTAPAVKIVTVTKVRWTRIAITAVGLVGPHYLPSKECPPPYSLLFFSQPDKLHCQKQSCLFQSPPFLSCLLRQSPPPPPRPRKGRRRRPCWQLPNGLAETKGGANGEQKEQGKGTNRVKKSWYAAYVHFSSLSVPRPSSTSRRWSSSLRGQKWTGLGLSSRERRGRGRESKGKGKRRGKRWENREVWYWLFSRCCLKLW